MPKIMHRMLSFPSPLGGEGAANERSEFAADEGFLHRTPHPASLRSATFSPTGRRKAEVAVLRKTRGD